MAFKLLIKGQFRQLKEKIFFFFSLRLSNRITNGTFSISDIEDFSPQYLTSTQVAVHIHIHYIDVAKIIIPYLKNMPVRYDLYISLTDSNFEHVVRRCVTQLSNKPDTFHLAVVENRGRNVAPLVVEFAQSLQKYKYFCHIHTKKSLYSGRERSDWLRYLATALLGSKCSVGRIISLFDSYDNIGIIYPETYSLLPYWAHTWLSNKHLAQDFFQKLGIEIDLDAYIDAPMGTMFWARSQSLETLLAMGLSYDDFPRETGQNDGTLAHVIERALVPIVNAKGYTFCEIVPRRGVCRIGSSNRNLQQYEVKSKKEAIRHLLRYEVVTFDIFDTLLIRPILDADYVHDYVERLVRLSLKVMVPFSDLRRDAEAKLRELRSGSGDVSIDEIYEMMKTLLEIPPDLFDEMKRIELSAEMQLTLPRQEVVGLLAELVSQGKNILLVSDMYLAPEDIEPLLIKAGINGYQQLLVSSRTGMRKDNGQFWKYFIDNYAVTKHIHIGDNEHSDVQVPRDLGINSYHVMSVKNLFINSPYYDSIFSRRSFEDSVLLGLAANKVFSNPFASQTNSEHKQIKQPDTLGYFVFGPLFASFTIWLAKSARANGVGRLSFLSREGHLLKRLFEILTHSLAKDDPYFLNLKTDYLLVSRRATGVAAIKTESDVYGLLEIPFTGSVADLLSYRYGLEGITITDNCFLDTENEYEKATNKIYQYIPTILANAEIENKAYLKYLGAHGDSLSLLESVVDVGYSGTIQRSLQKILERKLTGYYLFTTEKAQNLNVFSCFGKNITSSNSIPLNNNLLFLESVMLSPNAQLIKFDSTTNGPTPIFRNSSEVANYERIRQVQQGIESYLEDLIRCYPDILLDFADASPEMMQMIFERICQNPELLSPSLRKDLLVEDTYTSAMVRRVFPVN